MPSVLDGLTSTPAPAESAPAAEDPTTRPMMVLRAVSAGQLPGVLVPDDAPSIPSNLTPDDIANAGVGLYKPTTPKIAVVLFNQKQVPLEKLQSLDKEGKLAESLPSITSLLGGPSAPAADAAPAPGATTAANLVPVLPRSAGGHDAAMLRMKSLLPVDPSQRQVPGGGTVLNGLLQRPV